MNRSYPRLFLGSVLFLLSLHQVFAQQQVSAVVSGSAPVSSDKQPDPAPPAPATPKTPSDMLNSHLPSWLRFSGEIRLRGAGILGDFFKPDSNDAYMLSRLRLNMQIKTRPWLSFNFQAQDAHVIGSSQTGSLPPLQQDTLDLRLAYVEFGQENKTPVRVRIGRQELAFGEERLIGPANWLNTPRSFDALSGTFRTAGVRLDAFAASVVKIHDGQFNENTPGNYISGLYTSFSKLIPQAALEPYFFWRRQSGLTTETHTRGISDFGTVGFRWAGKSKLNIHYAAEMAKQAGSLGSNTISAWAGHWLLGYTLAGKTLTPRLFAEYNYASGDKNPTDGKRGTFDQLFPSAHDLYGLTDQIGWKNIRHLRTGVEVKPRTNWSFTTKYSSYWLADPHDALYNSASIVIAKSPAGRAGVYVGQELDFVSSIKYKLGPVLSGGFGHLFPGTFLKVTTPGRGYNFPYLSVLYVF
jgi:hypothetical protein